MAKLLTTLALMVALGGSVLAGMPLHSDEQECNMPGMSGDMDCCAKAHKQSGAPDGAPDVAIARLCCAVNCESSGTTGPTGSVQPASPLAVIAEHPASIQSPFIISNLRPFSDSAKAHLENSQPTYIRHLALLI